MADGDQFKFSFSQAFLDEWEKMKTSDMKRKYQPSRANMKYDESQDGLKVLLILLVFIWKKSHQEISDFIKALNSSQYTEKFAGATYRLGALIFGTQTDTVSRCWILIANVRKDV